MTAEPIAPKEKPGRAGWLVVALLLLVQFAMFRQLVQREVASTFPLGMDQTCYLSQAYDAYEAMLDKGASAGLREAIALPVASGCLLHVQAALVFVVMGPSRFAALLPNFLYFAAFQCVVVALLLHWTRRWGAAFFALGLLLCAGSGLSWLGGLSDFRVESLAFSLYGILIGTCLLSDGFANRRWSLALGGVACLLFLFRYLTIVYLTGIVGLWVGFLFVSLVWWRRDAQARSLILTRLLNTALAAVVLSAVVVPVIAWRWKILWGYYGVGHLTGGEKSVRAAEVGVFTQADSLLFYARSVWSLHAGWVFFAVAALGVALSLILWRRRNGPLSAAAWLVPVLAVAFPWFVLTANTAKSPLVGNVLVAALLWLFLLPVIRSAAGWPAWLTRTVGTCALLVGVAVQIDGHCQREPRFGKNPEDRRQLLALHDAVSEFSREEGWSAPRISADVITDCIPPHALGVAAYERQGLRLSIRPALGGSIFSIGEAEGQALVRDSEFVLLRDGPSVTCPAFPARESLEKLRPWLNEYCHDHLIQVGSYPAMGGAFTLYARPSLRASTPPAQWVTSDGLHLKGRADVLRTFPKIRLTGRCESKRLVRAPNVEAVIDGRTFPAQLTFTTPHDYELAFTIPDDLKLRDGSVSIVVRFGTYFVPRDCGINEDTRQLVVCGPAKIEFHRRAE